jgi:hypothetical protein
MGLPSLRVGKLHQRAAMLHVQRSECLYHLGLDGQLTSLSCTVYPEDGKPSFTLPNCKPYFDSREVDEGSTELDPMFAPNPHVPVTPKPKPKPRPNRPPPQKQRIRALESEGSLTQSNSGDEIDGCPKTCEGKYYCCQGRRDTNEPSKDLDPACPPKLCKSPNPLPPKHPVTPQDEDTKTQISAEISARSSNDCLKWENGKCLDENVKRASEESDHPPFNGINAGSPGEQRPSVIIHSSQFTALQVESVAKDCRGKTGGLLTE